MTKLGVPFAALALALGGCASSSIGSDVGRVRELTRVSTLANVADTDVDPAVPEEARKLLAKPLDADAAVRIALLNNRELRATLREMGIFRGRLVQAGLLPNPSVEAELVPEPDSSLELRVEYDLTRALFAPMRSRAAEPEVEAARYRAAAAVIETGGRVRAAFYAWSAAEQRLALAHQSLDAWAAGVEAASAMFQAGNVPELDLAGNVAAYEKARVAVAETELEVATAREHLLRLLGVQGLETKIRIAGELPAAPREPGVPAGIEGRAVRASLELREARERLEGLSRRSGLATTTGIVPDLSVDVHALRETDETDAANEDRWRWGAGVNVTIPLFDRNQGTAAALDAEFDALLERYYGMAVDVRSAAREAKARVLSAHSRAQKYATVIVPAEQRVVEQTLLQYNAMQVGVFQLLDARRDELAARYAYVDALRAYWTAHSELEALLAGRRVSAEGAEARRAPAGDTGETSRSGGGH
ncbi:MAG TPA: TolC family protein [Polyangiaceae bacterium]